MEEHGLIVLTELTGVNKTEQFAFFVGSVLAETDKKSFYPYII